MVLTTISFNIPTRIPSHPCNCYRYEVIFNLRILTRPLTLEHLSSMNDHPLLSSGYPHSPGDDGRRKRDRSDISDTHHPSSEEEEISHHHHPQTKSSSSSTSAHPLPHCPSMTSSVTQYQSGVSHLSMDCSVDILQLYTATLKVVREQSQYHFFSRTQR